MVIVKIAEIMIKNRNRREKDLMEKLSQKQTTGKRFAAVLLAVMVFGILLFSNLYISEHIQHDCTGEDCPICAQIQSAESLIHQLGCGLMVFFAMLGICLIYAALLPVFCFFISGKTLISNKVRLND